MNQLSDRINRLAESATLAMARKSREMTEQGLQVISLSLGEPDFDTPDFVKEAAKQAIDDNFSKYPPVNGYLDLRKAIAHKFERDNGLHYTPEQIVVSTGAKQSIANLILSLINPGDEVIIPAPYWVSYKAIINMAEGVAVEVPSSVEQDFKISKEQLEASITPKTRMLLFSSPCNPSGSVYSKADLRGFADVLKKHPNIICVSDEIYEHINFVGGHVSIGAFDDIFDQVVTVNGVSKAFAMTGWRIGYIGAPAWIAKACSKMQGQSTSGANTIAQKAAQAAVSADPASIHYMRDEFLKRRDMMLELLAEMPGVKTNLPEGAFYVFPDVSSFFGKTNGSVTINNAEDLSMYLLEEAHIALVTGDAFGAPACMRISYAASEAQLRQAMSRMKTALSQLKERS